MTPFRAIASLVLALLLTLGTLGHARADERGGKKSEPVTVTNSASSPVLTRDIDNGAFQPVRFRVTARFTNTTDQETTADGPTVPAGKRLVVESVYVFGIGTDAEELTAVWLSPKPNPDQQSYLLLNPTSAERQTTQGNSVYGYARSIKAYFDPGDTILLEIFRGPTSGPLSNFLFVNAYVQGHYVTLP